MTGAILGAFAGLGSSIINNLWSDSRTQSDRAANYFMNEQAAALADRRTRALYEDFYSPSALIKQYKEAGLSPSILFGGTPGQGGMSGAMSQGSQGLQTPYAPFSLLEAVQAANIVAQTDKVKAETKNISKDTDLKALEEEWNLWRNNIKSNELNLVKSWFDFPDGSKTSLFEMANETNNYNDFLKNVRVAFEKGGNPNNILEYLSTELGQEQLRKIWFNANKFETEINILTEQSVSSKFQTKVLNCLNKQGFAEQNASTAINELKAAAEVAELTSEQKGAWNRLLAKLEQKNATAKDIAVIAGMIVSGFARNNTFIIKK